MLLKQIMNRTFNKKVTNYMVPITKAQDYYKSLETENGRQINPFRKLTEEIGNATEADVEESPLRCNDFQDRPFQDRHGSNMIPLFQE